MIIMISWMAPVQFVGSYVKGINDWCLASTKIGDSVNKGLEFWSSLGGVSSGGALAGRGAADAAEAWFCQDKVCFTVSCVGMGADALQIAASFVAGPNVTMIATMPVSIGCKSFVAACKGKTLPWGGC